MKATPSRMKLRDRPKNRPVVKTKRKFISKKRGRRDRRKDANASGMINMPKRCKKAKFANKKNGNKQKRKRQGRKGVRRIGRFISSDIEWLHQGISHTYTILVYHFARVITFFKLIRSEEPNSPPMALTLTNSQSRWMGFIEQQLSSADELFPDFSSHAITFLLHPNSLHSVFQSLCRVNASSFSWTKVLFMVFAFLKKRGLLTVHVYVYLQRYWKDVIRLVEQPEGEEEMNQTRRGRRGKRGKQSMTSMPKSGNRQHLQNELTNDPSVAAFELASYLYVCQQHFQLQFTS